MPGKKFMHYKGQKHNESTEFYNKKMNLLNFMPAIYAADNIADN